ncbi:MAG: TonB-dependent receptor [Gammaproteobacteria bacterium]|nr:TonB-dependent receptor [Gammaproteobacteria bacterium]
MKLLRTVGVLLFAGLTSVCYASDSEDNMNESDETENTDSHMEEVTIVAHPLSGAGVRAISDADVVSVDHNDLDRVRAENLADVVSQVPGVRNASFGSGSAHPVIHGMDGPRVLLLYDRLRPMDVATTPGDHPPLVEPFVANQIEILKGPNTLLFGSGSSGGVINAETGRIPTGFPDGGAEYRFEMRARDNGNRLYGAGHADFGFNDFVLHVDGYSRSAGDYKMAGCAMSSALIEQHELEEMEHADEEDGEHHEEEENPCGTLPNSDVENRGGSIGLSFVQDWGFVGVALASSNTTIGIPIEHEHHDEPHEDDDHHDAEDDHHDSDDDHHEPHMEGERVHIDLEYSRLDLEMGVDTPIENVDHLSWRIGFSDYSHDELENDVPETTFERTNALDSRLVVTTPKINDWTHAIGWQTNQSEFIFTSGEANSMPIKTAISGLFWVGHTQHGKTDYQLGVRIESAVVDHQEFGEKDFVLFNASGGFAYPLNENLMLDATLDFSSRAPLADELFVEGVHLATGSHLEANPDLSSEDIRAVNVSLEYGLGRLRASATGYVRWADSFIYDIPTGEVEDGLPVYQFRQNDASFVGSDLSLEYRLYEDANWVVNSGFSYDFVNAKVDLPGNDNFPREPANRLVSRFEAIRDKLTAVVSVVHHTEVSDTPEFILPTDAYTDVSVDVEYEFDLSDRKAKLFMQTKNLLDSEQRPHTSPIKDAVPLPGRSIEFGFSISG